MEPSDDFQGTLVFVVSNHPYVGPRTTNLPTLSDPVTGPYEFSKDAPYQWFGVLVQGLQQGTVDVNVFASPYSRNIQP